MPLLVTANLWIPLGVYGIAGSEDGKSIWQAAGLLGGQEKWGLTWRSYSLIKVPKTEPEQVEEYLVEPYTFSKMLVHESFRMIDEVAKLTNIEGLFPAGYSIPKLADKPPEDMLFGKQVRERLDVLG